MVGVPCSEREHTVPLPCTKQHHSPVYAELRCCVINTFFNNVCPPYKAWERRGGVTPSPPPKPPRQRRRAAQTGGENRGWIAEGIKTLKCSVLYAIINTQLTDRGISDGKSF